MKTLKTSSDFVQTLHNSYIKFLAVQNEGGRKIKCSKLSRTRIELYMFIKPYDML